MRAPAAPAAPAQLAALREFRRGLYGCLGSWGDALFELIDALACRPGPVASVPALSLEPVFRRGHGSLYKSLARGEVCAADLRRLLVASRPERWPLVFAVDTSTWDRCDAKTSPERGFYHSPSRQSSGQPVVAGWSYQWVAQLCFEPGSWTAPLDVARVPPTTDGTQATVEQLTRLVGLLPSDGEVPLFVLDAGYDPIAIGDGLAGTRAQVAVRLHTNRVFYADPRPRRAGAPGRHPRHGRRFKLSDARTAPRPDAEARTHDPRYGTVRVRAWHRLHPRLGRRGRWSGEAQLPIVRGSVLRVDVEHLPTRATKALWLWWSGPGEPDLELCAHAYLHRFDLEHTFRFAKTALGWTAPALQMPAQADRWTWLVVAAYTQLRLARGLVDDMRLPWERPCAPAELTPARVRRGFHRVRAQLGTPARAPKSATPGPGRPRGTARPRRTRYPVVRKAA
jgi:hypothetical protein